MKNIKDRPFGECTKYSCKQTFAVRRIYSYIYIYISIYLSQVQKSESHLALNSFMMKLEGPKTGVRVLRKRSEYEELLHSLSVLTFEEFLKHQTSAFRAERELHVGINDAYSDLLFFFNATGVPETRRSPFSVHI